MVRPGEVRSPRQHWTLIEVIYDGGTDPGDSLAVGEWDGERVLAARWNGDSVKAIGNPQSRGLPTWFVIPDRYFRAILDSFSGKELPPSKRKIAEALLGLEAK
jgi:hypothetical protein